MFLMFIETRLCMMRSRVFRVDPPCPPFPERLRRGKNGEGDGPGSGAGERTVCAPCATPPCQSRSELL